MLPALFTSDYLSRLETLRMQTRRRFLGSRPGGHVSLRRGAGLEFADYRRYTPGDDLRYIDWNLYGRTDRLYIKQFQEEEDLYTSLFLDGSASMAHPAQDGKAAVAGLASRGAAHQGCRVTPVANPTYDLAAKWSLSRLCMVGRCIRRRPGLWSDLI